MSEQWLINNESRLNSFCEYARGELAAGKTVLIGIQQQNRTPDQNSYYHAILRDVAKQKGDETVEELKRYTKLHFAVPMLRDADPDFRGWYDGRVKGEYSYEQKLTLMDALNVTSMMNKEQMSSLIDAVVQFYSEQGYTIKV